MEQSKEIQSGCEAGIYQPLLAYISAKKMGRTLPNYTPQFKPIALCKLAKLALLYSQAGFKKESGKLCAALDRLKEFPTLWCPEHEYHPTEFNRIFNKLSSIVRVPNEDPIDVTFIQEHGFSGALTLSGNGTSLGAIYSEGVEIRAFGPQSQNFSFGIRGAGLDGWTQTLANRETWLNLKHSFEEKILKLSFHLVGIKPESPQHMAFYVKAKRAEVGTQAFLPKSLERFKGQADAVSFENHLSIKSSIPLNIQVIPLAGEGCYWDCDFLILFEINSFVCQFEFSLNLS